MSAEDATGSLWRSVKEAYSGWAVVVSIALGCITAFNLVRKMLDIGLSKVFADVMQLYEQYTHVPIQFVFDRLGLPHPPSWFVDSAIVWFLIGGIVLKGALAHRKAYRQNPHAQKWEYSSPVYFSWPIDRFFQSRVSWLWIAVYIWLLWPHMVIVQLWRPRLMIVDWVAEGNEFEEGELISWYGNKSHQDAVLSPEESAPAPEDNDILCEDERFMWHVHLDSRVVLAVQAGTMLAAVVVLVAGNELLKRYGLV